MIDLQRVSLHRAYAEGMSLDHVVDEVFGRIAAVDDPGIFIVLRDRAAILDDAARLGAFDPIAKPLWGIPFAVKDNIDVAAVPTTAACPAFAYTPVETAFAVQKLLDAGALLIGKTNLDQFATGLVGTRTPYPVPRNAVCGDLVPGGSSSGSAVAVAHGIVTFALGTDTAGSGRVPAALNNIVGLKPTVGAVSARGVFPACRTLDCVSVFALSVDDAWLAYSVMAGHDPDDPFSKEIRGTAYAAAEPKGTRIGVPSADSRVFFGDAEAERAFEASLATLVELGAELVEFDYASFRQIAELLYNGPWVAERYEAVRSFIEATPEQMHPTIRTVIESAKGFSAADAFAGVYRLAHLKREVEAIWRGFDIIVVPSIPTVYTRAEDAEDPFAPNSRLGTYTNFVNFLGLSALAVPGQFRSDGRPAGITFVGKPGDDGALASVGRAFHQRENLIAGATAAKPAYGAMKSAVPADYISLVVVGAHMSELALNHELKREGAVFIDQVQTAPDYRLYALPGEGPSRPGLLRVAAGTGVSVACEVWALSESGFGRFVAKIPSPLGIGTISLAGGVTHKGFLCEAAGVVQAEDISQYGGWRAYLAATAMKGAAAD